MKIRLVQTDYSEFKVQRLEKERNIDYMREWIDIRTYETEREAIDCLNEIKKGVLDEFGKFKEKVIEEYEI